MNHAFVMYGDERIPHSLIAIELAGMRVGQKVETFEQMDLLFYAEQAGLIMSRAIYRVRMRALGVDDVT